MTKQRYIGFNLGAWGLPELLVRHDGTPVASSEASYPSEQPKGGWSEQDPALWVDAFETVLTGLRDQAPEGYSQVAAIGVSGHMHGAVLLDVVARDWSEELLAARDVYVPNAGSAVRSLCHAAPSRWF